jgi:hypothetical protein
MGVSRWQQLGAFVGDANSLSYDQLKEFHTVGGRWIAVLLAQLGYPYDHDPACVHNVAKLLELKEWCTEFGVACGGWFNGWAGGELHTTAAEDAEQVRRYVQGFNLGPVILDCEAAYKEHPQELPHLLMEVRKRIKTRSIGVSTNEPNDSLVWNGGAFGHKSSMYHLGIRLLPQWYSSPNYSSVWMRPDLTMKWLKEHGDEDNFLDYDAPANRAVPLSYVHGTLEVTGLEGASLATSIEQLKLSKQYGYTSGFSIYMLEAMPQGDFKYLADVRGSLFYV